MGYDLTTAERVRRVLAIRNDVEEKRMVGGLSFVVGGSMCCGVTGNALMVRVGAEARDRVLAERHVRPMEFAGRSLAGFVLIDPEGFRTDTALAVWVQRGLDFVAVLPANRRAAVSRASPRGRRDPSHP
jgi:hypothetical protein